MFASMGTATEPETTAGKLAEKTSPTQSDPIIKVDITRMPTEDTEKSTANESRTVLHIYFERDCGHISITPTLSLSQERRWGPKPKEQKTRRVAKKAAKKLREASRIPLLPIGVNETCVLPTLPLSGPADKDSYFMHTSYLSFHLPPSVLYVGSDRYAPSKPVALVHAGCFWRSYRIQLGPSLAFPGVIDPRGVVSWRHNGGSKRALQDDERNGDGTLLRGYKVRGWRLWGETGKSYVHTLRDKRTAGDIFDDPDVDDKSGGKVEILRADEAVKLSWTRPLSRSTRVYTFHFRSIEFQWRGTSTVSEGRRCGWMLRFCHLKLIAKGRNDRGTKEVCLARYTSSIAAEKSGTLEVFDCVVLRFVEEHMPSLLGSNLTGAGNNDEHEEDKIADLKKGIMYQLIVATVLCMARAEKEKRHTLIDLVIGILESGGNGGG
ncbi:hypothetical protein C7974DRAFT_391977 [Boeremia exigua]|uniref:uncharacterized protein n=1 Tax=Boeremia exigua TaxID=749465 RepID=UPI001E8D2952|nr:uncharacterized protein C7974DRAFT_391977 [Boeremia exigua]KAH6633036.1 hypothetical protein C7974DRAFT_391977 [Boeremia exigua]